MPPGASSLRQAALGIRSHSGWAVVIAAATETIVLRRTVEIVDRRILGAVQPYHHVEAWPLTNAEEFLKKCAAATNSLAHEALQQVLRDVESAGFRASRACLLLSSGRLPATLAETLSSHPRIHTAEGEFYRDAWKNACERCGIPVTGVKERELQVPAAMRRKVDHMGKTLGPPWRQDEKLATLAAWLG